MQGVTLGGTGKEVGNRHPKVGDGALIGACVTILGNIKIGEGAMIAAGSLVLKEVPPHRYKLYSKLSKSSLYCYNVSSDNNINFWYLCCLAWWQEHRQRC